MKISIEIFILLFILIFEKANPNLTNIWSIIFYFLLWIN